jgi:hypothetical protein
MQTSITTLDNSSEWQLSVAKSIDIINKELPEYSRPIEINYNKSDLRTYTFNDAQCIGYTPYPSGEFDFIFIDGPPLDSGLVCLDPLVNKSFNKFSIILIDGRNINQKIIYKNLKVNDRNWKRYFLAYPSDDCLFINSCHPCFEAINTELSNCLSVKFY